MVSAGMVRGGAGVVPIRALHRIPYLPFPAHGPGGCSCGMGDDTGRGGMGWVGAGEARGGGRCDTGGGVQVWYGGSAGVIPTRALNEIP